MVELAYIYTCCGTLNHILQRSDPIGNWCENRDDDDDVHHDIHDDNQIELQVHDGDDGIT
jgi:hypothetical protein